jgi:hypothetical protein
MADIKSRKITIPLVHLEYVSVQQLSVTPSLNSNTFTTPTLSLTSRTEQGFMHNNELKLTQLDTKSKLTHSITDAEHITHVKTHFTG